MAKANICAIDDKDAAMVEDKRKAIQFKYNFILTKQLLKYQSLLLDSTILQHTTKYFYMVAIVTRKNWIRFT